MSTSLPMTPVTDAAALARLRALPDDDAETLLGMLLGLGNRVERQDHLITAKRIALSLPALDAWLVEAQAAKDERRFRAYLAEVQRAAVHAEEFRTLLSRAETLHQVNVTLLAARLFDALVARDQTAIEQLTRSFAEVVNSLSFQVHSPTL